jgi:hypothetical protein
MRLRAVFRRVCSRRNSIPGETVYNKIHVIRDSPALDTGR